MTKQQHSPKFSRQATLDVFTARDLRNRSGELLRDAEEGRLAVITKHGRPMILAIPFDQRLLELGAQRALGLGLFESGHVGLAQAARLSGLALDEFLDLLGELGIPAVDYPPEELDDELRIAS